MSDELKPCPFCGAVSSDVLHQDNHREGCFLRLYADNCEVWYSAVLAGETVAPAMPHRFDEQKEAWNARAAYTDEQFAIAVHNGEAWQVVRECHIRYHGGTVSEGGMEAEDWYYCDACGEELPKWAQDAWDEYESCGLEGAMPFRHCPECGAKVVA